MPTKNYPPLPKLAQNQSATAAQLRRTNCQRRSPNSSPQIQQRSRQNITNNQAVTTTTTTATAKGYRNGKHCLFVSTNNSNHRHILFGHNNNNYYSSKMDRSIVNCEKFLPDQDLINSTKENDLLLIHARQSTRFM